MSKYVAAAKWTAGLIADAIARQTLEKKCLVLVDNCNWTGYECDVLGVTADLRIIDVEVKISRGDLKADAKKDKWWHRIPGHYCRETGAIVRPPSTPRQHPPKVWKHYYALPADIWKPELLDALPSAASGVLLLKDLSEHPDNVRFGFPGAMKVQCVRRATPNRHADRLSPANVMAVARLANLRMWDAYRDVENARREAKQWREQALAARERP